MSEDELLAFAVHSKTDDLTVPHNGYIVDDIMTMLRSSICQCDIPHASYAALELYPRFRKQMWNRLLAASNENCHGVMTEEITTLCPSDDKVNGKKSIDDVGVEFLASIDSSLVEHLMWSDFCFQIPDYVFDVHTYRGKKRGKTKLDFFIDENNTLKPHQSGLFDNGSMGEFVSRSWTAGYRLNAAYQQRRNDFMDGKETDPTHDEKDFPEF